MKKISDIKNEYNEMAIPGMGDFISEYENDERPGVRAIVEKAKKKIDDYAKELDRIYKLKEYERKYSDCKYICGIDEAGRGPLAGPVVACAMILPADCDILYINDSKQLSEKKREELYDIITEKAISFGIGIADNETIDRINILNATYEAMRAAIEKLSVTPDILLNDAVTIPGVSVKQIPIIKGDAKSISIGAASIVAKVFRDRLMREYDRIYPEYGFAANKGYGSSGHIDAIKRFGVTPIHRKSFIGKLFTGYLC